MCGVTCVNAQRLPSDAAGRQRPEHVRSAFTTDLNHALLDVTHCYGHFSASHSLYSFVFQPHALQQADAVKKEKSHHVMINEAFILTKIRH
ncbi:hypothetical protein PSI19_20745 [Xenorhabdus khoisanae]|uniref:hypothetical protein n=1 Tax=Xenorhabdus khoisanae TaxID=880157 RepID=UPI0023592BC9|nr:hypothetical protein [Xenorhabdus khoisanae]MDC9616236.1 hypothetical protein [Xenorhabdus khoisanae]